MTEERVREETEVEEVATAVVDEGEAGLADVMAENEGAVTVAEAVGMEAVVEGSEAAEAAELLVGARAV